MYNFWHLIRYLIALCPNLDTLKIDKGQLSRMSKEVRRVETGSVGRSGRSRAYCPGYADKLVNILANP